ncbi:membrane fusion protein (multidrug efflux system) [Inquilinus ginsengisoli]|uniref:HlyD family secretion protein n=1 Tax=Inquilinus ginsengisoli TaxID=363840 RepID=UPI003D25E3E0
MTVAAISIDTAELNQPQANLPVAVGAAHAPARRRSLLRRVAPAILIAAVLGGGGYAGWTYWTQWRFEVSTDDAYVQADVVAVAPQVAGTVASLFVDDNQQVKAGQVLAIIDQSEYRAAVAKAQAGVQQAQAAIATDEAQIAQQQAVIAEAQATIDADKASEIYAQQNNQRFGTLAHEGFGSVQNAQQAQAQTADSQATVAKDEAGLDAAQKQVATLTAELAEAKATLAQNQAMLLQVQIDLGYTTITAPVDGMVGDRTVREGQYVEPGTQLLSVVPLARTYVVANFEETQLAGVRPGQPVTLSVDTFSGITVHGFVDSVAPASGQEFALLPPDNATGNFTKIVQRIPVKIRIDPNDPLAGRLRPGMSVIPTIDTHDVAPAGALRP